MKLTPEYLDALFTALSDPTRRSILAKLAEGEHSVGQLAAPFPISLPAISKHLRMLERAGLMERTIEGRVHHCRLAPTPLKHASEWLDQYRTYWGG